MKYETSSCVTSSSYKLEDNLGNTGHYKYSDQVRSSLGTPCPWHFPYNNNNNNNKNNNNNNNKEQQQQQ